MYLLVWSDDYFSTKMLFVSDSVEDLKTRGDSHADENEYGYGYDIYELKVGEKPINIAGRKQKESDWK